MAPTRAGEMAPAGPSAIAIRSLRKAFDGKVAVDGIDLEVPAGSFFGLVGPNGAGKSTTLAMATGLLRPDEGSIIVDGVDVWTDPVAAKRRVGVLPERPSLFERLTGKELLTYTGLLRNLPVDEVEARSGELLGVLGLVEAATSLVVDYSTGMRKKLALAAALLHAPRVLFLDEPFEGVDPLSVRAVREVLEQLTAVGATVVFSSHVLDLVERLCDRVAVMARGRILAAGTVAEMGEGRPLEEVFVELVGAGGRRETLSWLGTSSA